MQPYHRAMLAEGLASLGEQAEALACIEQALIEVGQTHETWYEAELHRRRGDLLLSAGREAEAASCFEKALQVARSQSARSWELRAAASLAKLQAEAGRRGEARDLLAPVYDWFTEGFDTNDLREAKALLDQLA